MESLAAADGTPRGRGVPTPAGRRDRHRTVAAPHRPRGRRCPAAGAPGTAGATHAPAHPQSSPGRSSGSISTTSPRPCRDGRRGRAHLRPHRRAAPCRCRASALEHVADGATVRLGLAEHRGQPAHRQPAAPRSTPDRGRRPRDPEAGRRRRLGRRCVAEPARPAPSTTGYGGGRHRRRASPPGSPRTRCIVVVARPATGGAARRSPPRRGRRDQQRRSSAYWSTVTDGAVGFAATAYPTVVTTTHDAVLQRQRVGTSCDVLGRGQEPRPAGRRARASTSSSTSRQLAACGGIAGLGTIGNGVGLRRRWSGPTATPPTGVLGHELGHNLGLGHSQELDCTLAGTRDHGRAGRRAASRGPTGTPTTSWPSRGGTRASSTPRTCAASGCSSPAPRRRRPTSGQVTLAPIAGATGTPRAHALRRRHPLRRRVPRRHRPRRVDGDRPRLGLARRHGAHGVRPARSVPAGMSFPLHASLPPRRRPRARTTRPSAQLAHALPVGTWIDLAGGRLGVRVVSQNATGAVIDFRTGAGAPSTPVCRRPARCRPPSSARRAPSVRVGAGAQPSRSSLTVPLRWTLDRARRLRIDHQARRPLLALPVVRHAGDDVPRLGREHRGHRAEPHGHGDRALRRREALGHGAVRQGLGRPRARRAPPAPRSGARRALRGKVSMTVTGRSVGLLLQRGPKNGRVAVYLDGRKVAVLDLRAGSASTRIAWASALTDHALAHGLGREPEQGHAAASAFDGLVASSCIASAGAPVDRPRAVAVTAGWPPCAAQVADRDRGELRQRQPRRRPPGRPRRGRRGQRGVRRWPTATTRSRPRRCGSSAASSATTSRRSRSSTAPARTSSGCRPCCARSRPWCAPRPRTSTSTSAVRPERFLGCKLVDVAHARRQAHRRDGRPRGVGRSATRTTCRRASSRSRSRPSSAPSTRVDGDPRARRLGARARPARAPRRRAHLQRRGGARRRAARARDRHGRRRAVVRRHQERRRSAPRPWWCSTPTCSR